MSKNNASGVFILLTVPLISVTRVAGASFEPLDFRPTAVSADGSVIVGAAGIRPYDTPRGEGVRWTRESGILRVGFLHPGDEHSPAYGTSADGMVVVGAGQGEAFRWTGHEGMVGLGLLEPGAEYSSARDVSTDGSVVVGWSGHQAFRWTAEGGMVGLGLLPGKESSRAFGVSGDGSVVAGGSGDEVFGDTQAFRWTAQSGMVGLGYLPRTYSSIATAVSADGSVIVGYSGAEAFRWTAEEGMIGLGIIGDPGYPAFHQSRARGVSADGSLIVGTTIRTWPVLPVPDGAWIWDEAHGMRGLEDVLTDDFRLQLGGLHLLEAVDISDDGRVIVGWGTLVPSGDAQGFRAVIPEPSTLALLTTAALALAACALFRRNPR